MFVRCCCMGDVKQVRPLGGQDNLCFQIKGGGRGGGAGILPYRKTKQHFLSASPCRSPFRAWSHIPLKSWRLMITGSDSWGAKSTPLPVTVTRHFSIIFSKHQCIKQNKVWRPPPALIVTTGVPSLLLTRAVGKAGCKTPTGWSNTSLTWGHLLCCWLFSSWISSLCSWQSGSWSGRKTVSAWQNSLPEGYGGFWFFLTALTSQNGKTK